MIGQIITWMSIGIQIGKSMEILVGFNSVKFYISTSEYKNYYKGVGFAFKFI